MSVLAPKIATAERHDDTVIVRADGVAVLALTSSQATWLIARLAEVLAVRS